MAQAKDVEIWRALRRDGIARYPSAFMASLEEHDAIPPSVDASRLALGGRFLGFQNGEPTGLIGLNRHELPRASHRAEIGPFYVIPAAHGSDAATALLNATLKYAIKSGIWQVELSVNEANPRAVAFYQKHGFAQIGRIPNAIIGAEGPETDLMMLRDLSLSA